MSCMSPEDQQFGVREVAYLTFAGYHVHDIPFVRLGRSLDQASSLWVFWLNLMSRSRERGVMIREYDLLKLSHDYCAQLSTHRGVS